MEWLKEVDMERVKRPCDKYLLEELAGIRNCCVESTLVVRAEALSWLI